MLRLTLSLVILVAVAGLAPADEIIFKQDYGDGKSVQCQVYKETEDYIHYIDIKKDQDAGCSKAIVEKVVQIGRAHV